MSESAAIIHRRRLPLTRVRIVKADPRRDLEPRSCGLRTEKPIGSLSSRDEFRIHGTRKRSLCHFLRPVAERTRNARRRTIIISVQPVGEAERERKKERVGEGEDANGKIFKREVRARPLKSPLERFNVTSRRNTNADYSFVYARTFYLNKISAPSRIEFA